MQDQKKRNIFGLLDAALAIFSLPGSASPRSNANNTEMISAIAREIVNCGELNSVDWGEVSAIFSFDDDGDVRESYGYAYERSGNAHAAAFLYDSVEKEVKRCRARLRLKNDKGIIKMLIQFNKETRSFNADFEYDDPSRWQVTPNNIGSIAEQLRLKADFSDPSNRF
ncbi:hypothetical protein [Rhizobium sp. ZPR3]|uniref:DUF600 family protein n=2 Tax=unclassified Rhizobium TaxID=2613769 RepID=A0AAU7SS06_9HYPH